MSAEDELGTETLIAHVGADGRRFAELTGSLDPSAAVPSCPGWDVEELVRHLGTTHRWSAAIVSGARGRDDRPHRREFVPDAGVNLQSWFAAGLNELLSALRSATDTLHCFTLYPAANGRWFWANRQALETVVHRADAELAAGLHPHIAPELAHAGMVEMLDHFAPRQGREATPARTGVVELCPADGLPWTLTFGATGLRCEPVGAEGCDARVRGSSSQVLLWLWNRSAGAVVEGDAELAAQWSQLVRI